MTEFKPVTPEEAQGHLNWCESESDTESFNYRMARTIIAVGKVMEELSQWEDNAREDYGHTRDPISEAEGDTLYDVRNMLGKALGVKYA